MPRHEGKWYIERPALRLDYEADVGAAMWRFTESLWVDGDGTVDLQSSSAVFPHIHDKVPIAYMHRSGSF